MDTSHHCFGMSRCHETVSDYEETKAPLTETIFQSSSVSSLYQALIRLQHELKPFVACVNEDETKTLLEALEYENKALRKYIQDREARDIPTVIAEQLSSEPPVALGDIHVIADECVLAAAPAQVELLALPEQSAGSVVTPQNDAWLGSKVSQHPHLETPGATGRVSNISSGDLPAEIAGIIRRSVETSGLTASTLTSSTLRSSIVAADQAPERAFVINVRRLIEAQESFSLVHNLIESTAMAAFTLVGAGSAEQFRCTSLFLVFVVAIFFMHGHMWDTLEVADMKHLLSVINDDVDAQTPLNPNRLLKAISFERSKLPSRGRHLLELLFAFVCIWAWLLCSRVWDTGKCPHVSSNEENWLDTTCFWVVGVVSETDAEVLGMQTGVGTLMFLLHLLFDFMHYNETCAVMPPAPDGSVWDARRHGVPWRFWFFGGLPSMWFTSENTRADLKKLIRHANRVEQVVNISPQEIAIYALEGEKERLCCKRTLKSAMLFDRDQLCFIGDETLNIDLFFFESALSTKEAYPALRIPLFA